MLGPYSQIILKSIPGLFLQTFVNLKVTQLLILAKPYGFPTKNCVTFQMLLDIEHTTKNLDN